MFVIAGLGNPSRQYEKTRHNAGFDAIDMLAGRYHIRIKDRKHQALCGTGSIEGQKVILVKPQTFMNASGQSVRSVMDFYKAAPETDLIVIYDDISLPPGKIRIRKKGSAGGHNGIKDIISHLGTQEFMRIKIGVGGNGQGQDLVWHVLGRLPKEDRLLVEDAFARACDAVGLMVQGRVDQAMNAFN